MKITYIEKTFYADYCYYMEVHFDNGDVALIFRYNDKYNLNNVKRNGRTYMTSNERSKAVKEVKNFFNDLFELKYECINDCWKVNFPGKMILESYVYRKSNWKGYKEV